METFIEDSKYQNLAMRKAEQKKLNGLKNMNLPWVFVEPTRLRTVKIPKAHKPLNYYEGLDDEDLEFLGNSKIPFTKEDIKILSNSLHRKQSSSIESYHDLENTSNKSEQTENKPLQQVDHNSNNIFNQELEKEELNLKVELENEDDEENIVSSRSNGNAINDLFASDDDRPKKFLEEEEQTEVENETVKNIIMAAVKEREEASKWKKQKILANRPVTFYSFETNKVTPNGQTIAKERMTKGRRKLLSAISNSSSLKNEEDSITYARNKFEKENALKRAALEKCFGTKYFKDYLEKQNAEIPQILLNVS